METSTAHPDPFNQPQQFISSAIKNIFKDETFSQNGILFSQYRTIPPIKKDRPTDRPNQTVQFHFRDLSSFINPHSK